MIVIEIKPGVVFKAITSEMRQVMNAVEMAFGLHQLPDPVITSANDGDHKGNPVTGRPSLHYSNQALDWRLKHIAVHMRPVVIRDVQTFLGSEYNVLHEYIGTDNEHMHVEYDPKVTTGKGVIS